MSQVSVATLGYPDLSPQGGQGGRKGVSGHVTLGNVHCSGWYSIFIWNRLSHFGSKVPPSVGIVVRWSFAALQLTENQKVSI